MPCKPWLFKFGTGPPSPPFLHFPGNYKGAVQEFTSAIAAHSNPVADFFAHRADAYMSLGPAFVTEARADVRVTLEKAPDHIVRVKYPHLV